MTHILRVLLIEVHILRSLCILYKCVTGDENKPPTIFTSYGRREKSFMPDLNHISYEQFVTNPEDNSQYNGTNAERCILMRTYMANRMSHVSQNSHSGECECGTTAFMFMARLALAISAFNRIIDTAGFQSNILSKMFLTAPIAQRYASSLVYIDTMMTDYVHMIELSATREMDIIVRRGEPEDRDRRQYMQTTTEVVAHSGLTVLREDNPSLQITCMEILSQISLFKTKFPPFLQTILFLSTCTPEVRDLVCAILAHDPAPERNGRGKMNFARGDAQMACFDRLYRYIVNKTRQGESPQDTILLEDYNRGDGDINSDIVSDALLEAFLRRFKSDREL